jgi:hypothetical protein
MPVSAVADADEDMQASTDFKVVTTADYPDNARSSLAARIGFIYHVAFRFDFVCNLVGTRLRAKATSLWNFMSD